MKSFNDIYNDLKNSFFKKTNLEIAENTVIDKYTISVSEAIENAHKEIEKNKTPHLYTGLKGQQLDELGYFLNCSRKANEEDKNYLYRLMTWKLRTESSNMTAINSSLINLKYSSNAEYVPLTLGVGTGTVFIIPNSYDEISKQDSIEEVHERLKEVISPSSFIEYRIPEPIKVSLVLYLISNNGDVENIKENIEKQIKELINTLAPGEYLKINDINKFGVNQPFVDYFNVSQIKINDEIRTDHTFLQENNSKMLFDNIIWWQGNEQIV